MGFRRLAHPGRGIWNRAHSRSVTIEHDFCRIRHPGARPPFTTRDSEEDGTLTAF